MKLKVKIGENEFEAEGTDLDVSLKFADWQRLIAQKERQSALLPAKTPNTRRTLADGGLGRTI